MALKKDYEEFMDDEYTSPEEAIGKISMLLAQTKRPELLSQLHDSEIKQCSVLQTLADKHDSLEFLSNIVENLLLFRISHDRKGRQELMDIGRGSGSRDASQEKSLRKMVLGLQ